MVYRRLFMAGGFLAAFAGDGLLAVRAAPAGLTEFLAGVACFALAHVLWSIGQLREARPDGRAFVAAFVPLALFVGTRLFPRLDGTLAAAFAAYATVSAFSFSVAVGGRRLVYALGISLLVASDVMIGARMLHAPGCRLLVGPLYLAAEALLVVSFFRSREPRLGLPKKAVGVVTTFGTLAGLFFALAIGTFPGGGYNPAMRMLSALGRTEVRGVQWPLCHFLFVAGMGCAAVASLVALLSRRPSVGGVRRRALEWGAALTFAGMLALAAVPENVCEIGHNAGCHLAAIGGGLALFALDRRASGRAWTVALVAVVAAFCAAILLHALKLVPFAPAVPTLQKVLILSFSAWIVRLVGPLGTRRSRLVAFVGLGASVAAVVVAVALSGPVRRNVDASARPPVRPLCACLRMTCGWRFPRCCRSAPITRIPRVRTRRQFSSATMRPPGTSGGPAIGIAPGSPSNTARRGLQNEN